MSSKPQTGFAESWQRPGSSPLLLPGQAHVWRCDLDTLPAEEYEAFLSEDEHERANRFHFPLHHTRYIAGRGVLRYLLAQYLAQEPREFSFILNAHGKPELASKQLRFNVSHSKNMALLAFCPACDVGVDIEFRRNDYDDEKIMRLARRFFCKAESEELATLNGAARQAAFFRCWTRKEALLKATGEGISGGLAKFQVSLLPGHSAQVLAPLEETGDWSLFDLQPGDGFAGALAVRSPQCEVSSYRLMPAA